jgi:hypothetical protein
MLPSPTLKVRASRIPLTRHGGPTGSSHPTNIGKNCRAPPLGPANRISLFFEK